MLKQFSQNLGASRRQILISFALEAIFELPTIAELAVLDDAEAARQLQT